MSDYTNFVASKLASKQAEGIAVSLSDLNPILFRFQAKIVRWALANGRAALFEDCGLGKSLQQLEWARIVLEHTGKPVLIYAPLTVGRQTQAEAIKLGLEVRLVQFGAQIMEPGLYITNYERHHLFDGLDLGGVVLDESSVLKNATGKIRTALIEQAQAIPFRLCCTATPAPNDITEIASHAEFLGIKTRQEMLAHWFVHDAIGWRLKGHATQDFYRWLATWSVFLRDPSDIGEDATGYQLPALSVEAMVVESGAIPDGCLFQIDTMKGVGDRAAVRKSTVADRVEAAALLIEREPMQSWVCWTGLNIESDALVKRLKAMGNLVVQVEGSTSEEDKVDRLQRFMDGRSTVLISKPRVSGFGLNFQHCSRQIFVGIGDSWEQYYQCLRRSYRFGQAHPVQAYIVTTNLETSIVENVMAKEAEAKTMGDSIIENIGDLERKALSGGLSVEVPPGHIRSVSGSGWTLHNGDCVEVMAGMADDSVDLSVYSPPFANLYTYSDNPRDMGNCVNYEQFYQQFRFAIDHIFRITKPGRLTCVHLAQTATTLAGDGLIGLNDFRGAIINAYKRAGFVHYREVTIDKCPQAQAIRTHSKALLFVQMKKDRSWSGPALADFICVFRKPGEPAVPIRGGVTNDEWIQWARPVWYGIRESDTLNVAEARSDKDERHICLAAGSLVLTRDGYIPIQDVAIGDLVLTHKGRWMPVTGKLCNGVRPAIRVCAQGVADLRVTPDHKLWTRSAKMKSCDRLSQDAKYMASRRNADWMPAEQTLGSYLNLKLPPVEESLLTEKEWWIVGRWLGDGHKNIQRHSGKRNGQGTFTISCSHNEAPVLIEQLGEFAGHDTLHQEHKPDRTATQVALKNLRPEVKTVLNRCGKGATGKRVPAEAICLSKEKAEALLSGYLSADGHFVDRYTRWCASSVSRALLLGMALVAQRARGIVASVYAGRPAGQGEIQGRIVNVSQDWIFAFRNEPGYKQSGWIGDDGAWKKVRKIEPIEDCEVWDISVAEDASFTAEGAIVKNCPLQLGVIKRCVKLWSNPGELVFSPFTGIGSEGYQSLIEDRRFEGSELKTEYFNVAARNLRKAELARGQQDLFSAVEDEAS